LERAIVCSSAERIENILTPSMYDGGGYVSLVAYVWEGSVGSVLTR